MHVKRTIHFTGKNQLISPRWVSIKFQKIWQWRICCRMLVLWFFSRSAEKEPVSDCSHHNIKANIMKIIFHSQIRAEWNSKALQFGTFTFLSFLNEVPNIRATYFFFPVDISLTGAFLTGEHLVVHPTIWQGMPEKAWNLI